MSDDILDLDIPKSYQGRRPSHTSEDGSGSAACTEVFATVELLEAVILHLPLKDTLLVQRVSTFWHATISGSKKLQKALCLAPMEQEAPIPKPVPSSPNATLWFCPIFSESDTVQDFYAEALIKDASIVNPYLQILAPPNEQRYFPFSEKLRRLVNEEGNSSLLKMFAVQPMSPNVMVLCRSVISWNSGGVIRESWEYGHGYSEHGYIKAANGVTVADVLRFVEKFMCDRQEKSARRGTKTYYFAITGCKMKVKES